MNGKISTSYRFEAFGVLHPFPSRVLSTIYHGQHLWETKAGTFQKMPHSGRWICSWRQSTYLQSYQISDDARHWTVYRLDYHSILLHYCFTAVSTLFHFCFTIFTSASWYCFTAVSLFSLLLHYCFMTALLFFHFCFIIVSLLFPYRFTAVSLLFHYYHITVS